MITAEELVANYQHTPTDETFKKILAQYHDMIWSIVQKLNVTNIPVDDLFAQGQIALLSAIERYDPSLNFKFSTYLHYRVYGMIQHYIRDTKSMVREPAWIYDLRQKERKVLTRFPNASEQEIANALEISIDHYHKYKESAIKDVHSLDRIKDESISDPYAQYTVLHANIHGDRISNEESEGPSRAQILFKKLKSAMWEGKTPAETAKKLKLPIEEVELAFEQISRLVVSK